MTTQLLDGIAVDDTDPDWDVERLVGRVAHQPRRRQPARHRNVGWLLVGVLLLLAASLSAATISRVTVATTATLIDTGSAMGATTVLIRNPGSASVYLGPAAVLTTTGFELAAGDAVTVPLGPSEALYGIVATGTVIVHVLEVRR